MSHRYSRLFAAGPIALLTLLVAEVGERSTTRTLSLRGGRYFVRARGSDVLYESEV